MEEILASIRRIIEDSEPLQADNSDGNARGEVAPFREEPAPVAAPANDADDGGAGEAASAGGADEAPAQPETMSDFKDEPVFSSGEAANAFDALRMEPGQRGLETTPGEGGNEEPRKSMHHQQPPTKDSTSAMPNAHGVENRTPSWQKTEDGEPAQRPADAEAREERVQQAAPLPRTKGGAEDTRTTILSEAPGRKVAAAFGELNEAYEASRRKSLADAAEEMLQPMLQEWLDNNLPQLVERLVREEIERIARGPSEDSQSGR